MMTQHTRNLADTAVRIGITAGACAVVILALLWLMPAYSDFWWICFAPLAAVSASQFALAGFLRIKGE